VEEFVCGYGRRYGEVWDELKSLFSEDFVWRSECVVSEDGRSRLRRNGSHFPVRWSGYPNANSTAAIS
jgi:hypothetical protein